MKRAIAKAFLFCALMAAGIGLAYHQRARRDPFGKSYYAAIEDKLSLLKRTKGKRLIAVGGSSVAFGIDSRLIGARCERQGVNMGLHGGFGLTLMLAQVERQLREGDIVLISPEYNLFTRFYRPDPELMAAFLERNPAFLIELQPDEAKEAMDRGFVMRVGRVIRSCFGGHLKGSGVLDRVYHRWAFDEHGDLTSYIGLRGPGPSGTPFTYKPGASEQAIQRLNSFYASCRRRGIQVFLTHPPFSRDLFERSKPAIDNLERDLRAMSRVPFLDTPNETIFEKDAFFDTAYHLNPEGRRIRSEQAATRLLTAIAVESSAK